MNSGLVNIPNEIVHEFIIDKPTATYMALAMAFGLGFSLIMYAIIKKLLKV